MPSADREGGVADCDIVADGKRNVREHPRGCLDFYRLRYNADTGAMGRWGSAETERTTTAVNYKTVPMGRTPHERVPTYLLVREE